jgi:hypothetical protein
MPRPLPRRWRKRTRELIELFLLPAAAALLPWCASLRLLRFLSRYRGWYWPEVEPATLHAAAAGHAPDPAAFARRMRWRLLVEHMDGFLVPLRGRRYMARWMRASGDPLPPGGPVLFLGTHYGCGYWFVPYLRDAGLPLNIIAPNLGPLLANSSLQENLYVRMRHRLLAIAAGRPLLYRGNAAKALRALLADHQIGFALADMPTTRVDAVDVELAGRHTRLAQNLFELAAGAGAPVYLFWSDTELETGLRRVHFQHLREGTPEQQVGELARMLDALIARDPSGWRFWSIAPSFFPALGESAPE